jgi:hypothetical protein
MEKIIKRDVFGGNNLPQLEANILEFIMALRDRYISQRLLSVNPQYEIEVTYYPE